MVAHSLSSNILRRIIQVVRRSMSSLTDDSLKKHKRSGSGVHQNRPGM